MAKHLPLNILLLFFVLFSSSLLAQETELKQSDFAKARQLAFDGNREQARSICYEILKSRPDDYDARILIGRSFAWDKNYEAARRELKMVLDADYDNKDAILAFIDLEKWSGNLEKAIYYCEYGQSFYPTEEQYLVKKIKLLLEKGQEEKALQGINELLDINPGSQEGLALFRQYKSLTRRYELILKHDFEHFKEPYNRRWHVSSLQLSKRTTWGSVIGKFNLGDLVGDGESLWSANLAKQFEVDAYPRISANNYLYLNYGYSPDNLFPEHRAGIEFYQKLPKRFEVSAGSRFLRFNGSSGSKNVYIYTGSLGKYYRNYWFSLRGYFTPKSKDFSKSYLLISRRYLRDAQQYVGLELGTGTSPDDARGNVSNIDTYKYDSWKVWLAYQDQLIGRRLTYLLRLGYEKEEYLVNVKRDIWSFSVKLSYQL